MLEVANYQEQEKLFLKLQCRFFCTGTPVISMSICFTILSKYHITESNDKHINCSSRRDNHGKVIEFSVLKISHRDVQNTVISPNCCIV
jgi:hypothetical protein